MSEARPTGSATPTPESQRPAVTAKTTATPLADAITTVIVLTRSPTHVLEAQNTLTRTPSAPAVVDATPVATPLPTQTPPQTPTLVPTGAPAATTVPTRQTSDYARCLEWLAGIGSLGLTGQSACLSVSAEARMAGDGDLAQCIDWLAGSSTLEIIGKQSCLRASAQAQSGSGLDLSMCLEWLSGTVALDLTGRSNCRLAALSQ